MFSRNFNKNHKLKCLVLVMVVSFIFQAIGMNNQAVKSAELKKYENEILILKDEVTALNFSVSKASNLAHIESKALSLGFIKSSFDIKVINKNLSYNTSQ
jgi:hypothetical protein